ncbi:MAG: hypothetical protein AAF684_10340, partial [Pseudomonadota bacterium]
MKYVIADSKGWFQLRSDLRAGHDVRFVTDKDDLGEGALADFAPDFIFFAHWSHIVPASVHERF